MDNEIHHLKLAAEFYPLVKDGTKTFEARYDDRYYAPGDYLVLRREPPLPEPLEEDPIVKRVKYKLTAYSFDGLKEGYCVLALLDVPDAEAAAILEISSLREQLAGAGWVH